MACTCLSINGLASELARNVWIILPRSSDRHFFWEPSYTKANALYQSALEKVLQSLGAYNGGMAVVGGKEERLHCDARRRATFAGSACRLLYNSSRSPALEGQNYNRLLITYDILTGFT
jgi:hypothetical protein